MAVHPGCRVCSIVAASLVAVETDVGETTSAHIAVLQSNAPSVVLLSNLTVGMVDGCDIRQCQI